jgi:Ca2+-binding EF-hand superfamily protein
MKLQKEQEEKDRERRGLPGTFGIKPDERERFENLFNNFDRQNEGIVPQHDMQIIMQKHNLPREILGKVWQLVNPVQFDLPTFLVTMKLLSKE